MHERDGIIESEKDKENNYMKNNDTTENQEIIQRLKTAPQLFALISGCTKAPYVVCNQETFDDEIFLFFHSEDAQKEAKRLEEDKIPVKVAKLESKQMLMFYTSLYTMGINALMVKEGENECLIQLSDFVRRNTPPQEPDGNIWVENPALHLTSLYYMQELRREPGQEAHPQLQEWQEEISNYFAKGSFIVPVQREGTGIPVIKLNDQEVYQAIFTDIMEFQKFNQENQLRPIVVTADKIPQVLVAEARGVLLNPMGVRMPLQIKKAEQQ